MVTTLWMAYDIFLFILGYFLLDRKLTSREKQAIGVALVIGLGVAAFGGYTEHVDRQQTLSQGETINRMAGTISTMAQNLAFTTGNALKKQALELGSLLVNHSSNILARKGRHGEPDAESVRAAATAQEVQWINQYSSTYQGQVMNLRKGFALQGQSSPTDLPYANPKTAQDIMGIGHELIEQANQLK
jgi:hypothetical protein